MAQYSDIFQYSSFSVIMKNCTIEYYNVTLLKDLCDKKAGYKCDKLILNPANGSWTIPKTKGITKAPVPKKKPNMVEFKGVHTRFEDKEDMSLGKEELVYIPNKIESSTFKVFEGRRRVKRIFEDSDFYEEFVKYIHDLGCGSTDNIMVNNSIDLIRVAGIDLEPYFEINKRYKLPYENFSIVRIY